MRGERWDRKSEHGDINESNNTSRPIEKSRNTNNTGVSETEEQTRHTVSAPDTTAKLEGQSAVTLKQLGADLAHGDALDADILRGGVPVGIVRLVQPRAPDGI